MLMQYLRNHTKLLKIDIGNSNYLQYILMFMKPGNHMVQLYFIIFHPDLNKKCICIKALMIFFYHLSGIFFLPLCAETRVSSFKSNVQLRQSVEKFLPFK